MQACASHVHANFSHRLFWLDFAAAQGAPTAAKAQAPSLARPDAAANSAPTAPLPAQLPHAPAPHQTAPVPSPATAHEARHGAAAEAQPHPNALSSPSLAAPTNPTPATDQQAPAGADAPPAHPRSCSPPRSWLDQALPSPQPAMRTARTPTHSYYVASTHADATPRPPSAETPA